jgi:alpha-ribazole phosphatase
MVNLLDFSEQIKTFYLVRHGETSSTENGRICGHVDVELNPEGIEQAEFLAEWFSGFKIDSIFSSPLIRAVHTADIIAKAIKKPTYYKHSGLIEKKEGQWDGKTYWQIRDEDPKLWEKWSKDPIEFTPPDGESVKNFVARVGRALEDIRKNYETGNKIILTTHAGVIRAILIHALDIPVSNFFRIEVPVGSVSRIDWSDSFATLKFWGLYPEIQEIMLA